MPKNLSVFGIYPDRTTVSDAIDALHQVRYRPTDIAVLLADNPGSQDFAHIKRVKAPEGAAGGAVLGALAGAVCAWLIATGRLAIPGLDSLASVAPWIAVLAGAGALGALGWLAGFAAGWRKPEYVAKRYAGRLRHGGILLSVHCDDASWCRQARRTLKETGAEQIGTAPEGPADFAPTNRPIRRMPLKHERSA